jgi:serine protease Do
MNKILKRIICIAAVLVLCLSFAGCSLFRGADKGDISNLPNSTELGANVSFDTQSTATRKLMSRADAVELVARSVVVIEINYSYNGKPTAAYGSGVIIKDTSGGAGSYFIITCHHVISSGGEVTVYVPDANGRNFNDDDYNEEYKFSGTIGSQGGGAVTLVGGDKDSDIAVLRLKTTGKTVDIKSASIPVDGYKPRLGEEIFTVGNPSGKLPMTVMGGCISYIGRESVIGGVGYMDLYQIDAAINHGNSGGGLFNLYGELIGITNAGSEEYYCLNYAIPFEGAFGYVAVAKQLIATATDNNYGFVSGRWELGITIVDKEAGMGSYVVIDSVALNSNAAKAGIQVNDVVIALKYVSDGKEQTVDIGTSTDFSLAFYEMKQILSIGDSFVIVVQRNYSAQPISVTVNITEQYIFCDTGYYPTGNN